MSALKVDSYKPKVSKVSQDVQQQKCARSILKHREWQSPLLIGHKKNLALLLYDKFKADIF